MRVAILVSEKYNGENTTIDDDILKKNFEINNIKADIIAWENNKIYYKKYNCAIVRSCWGYDEKPLEFLYKMKEISNHCKLFNSYETILKNHNKEYLLNLEKEGVNIVPTILSKDSKNIDVPEDWEDVIIKPSISASSKNTFKLRRDEEEKIESKVNKILGLNKTPIIQKYINTVETRGETSVVVIGGKICYTVKKLPRDYTFQNQKFFKTELEIDEKNFVLDIINRQKVKHLYMRVDFLRDENNKLMLMEIELIEPGLYISKDPKIAGCIVEEIKRQSNSN